MVRCTVERRVILHESCMKCGSAIRFRRNYRHKFLRNTVLSIRCQFWNGGVHFKTQTKVSLRNIIIIKQNNKLRLTSSSVSSFRTAWRPLCFRSHTEPVSSNFVIMQSIIVLLDTVSFGNSSWKLLGTTHMIYYENNASQPKFFVHDLEPSFLIKKTAFFSGTVHQHTYIFHATNWSTAWGTVMPRGQTPSTNYSSKVKQSRYTPWRRMGEKRYIAPTHSGWVVSITLR
jgi:hypothetical protein